MLKIRHYSFSTSGGAGRVAQQLNSLQMKEGINSKLFTTTDGDIRNVYRNHPILFTKAIADFYLVRNDPTNPLFSLFRNGTSIEASDDSKGARVVNHFHWTPGAMECDSSFQNSPLVWTLHDMWPFTGGCHHSMNCEGFIDSCKSCPQVRKPFRNQVSTANARKFSFIDSLKSFAAVAPSDWMAKTASRSQVLQNKRIETIYNPIDDVFFESDTGEVSSERLGIPGGSFIIGTSATNLRDPIKGFSKLLQLLTSVADRNPDKKFALLCIGEGSISESRNNLQIIHTGFLSNRTEVASALSILDLFVSMSAADTAPLAIAEALASGVPIACSNAGGMAECTDSGRNGVLIDDLSDFENFINALAADETLRRFCSENARRFAKSRYSSSVVIKRYTDLYLDLIKASK
jgi:glycosyltransferase involved in cell wall biosynthesis